MSKLERRKVEFGSFDDVLRDVQRLHQGGYQRAGNWELGEMCAHLAFGIEMTLDSKVPAWLRQGVTATFLRIVSLGRIGNALGLRVPTGAPRFDSVAESEGIERLKSQVDRLLAANEASLSQFHLWHCEHHLSFLIPADQPPQEDHQANDRRETQASHQ